MKLGIGANRNIDESRVPDNLSALIPYAKRWGFERNTDQDQFISQMQRKFPEEVSQFKAICDKHHKTYHEWLTSIPNKHMDNMTESDWTHPIYAFTSMYKVRELLPLEEHEITDEMREMKRCLQEEWRQAKYLETINEADIAFRLRDYTSYIKLLEPYQDLLKGSVEKKFYLAKKKCEGS